MAEMPGRRLDSWKEIADYLGREVRTVIRWEKGKALPVRRVPGGKRQAVFAYTNEIDGWLAGDGATPSKPAIAVLPLMNGDLAPDDEYLTDGISETVIRKLSQVPQIRVMAWSTVAAYKNRKADPRRIGRELNVSAVLTGNIAPRGAGMVVSVELVDASDGAQLWGAQYAPSLAKIHELPDEIAAKIAQSLRLRLTVEEGQQLSKRSTQNAKAYDLYLRASYHLNKSTPDGINKALEYFEKAIAEDSTYGLAYAGLAECYAFLAVGHGDLPPKELFEKASAAARKALEIDDTLAEAHCALGWSSPYHGWDWRVAEKAFQRAIELNPSCAAAHWGYAYVLLVLLKRDHEALQEMRCALELDPLSLLMNSDLGAFLAFAGRYDEAIEQARETLEMEPNHALAHYTLGWVYERKGMYREAVAALEKSVSLSLLHTLPLGVLGHTYAAAGKHRKALAVLDRLDELASKRPVSHVSKALVWIGLGEKEKAFESLEMAYGQSSPMLYYLNIWPHFDNLRSEPRFQELMQRIGLPQ